VRSFLLTAATVVIACLLIGLMADLPNPLGIRSTEAAEGPIDT
jgi:hypothetical protein